MPKDYTRARDFCMSFVSVSDDYKSQFLDNWREISANFIVTPNFEPVGKDRSPYRYGPVYKPRRNQIILKDPETHKLVMTYASKIVRSVFGDAQHEYVKAEPNGWEDATGRSQTVTRLLRYAFNLPGTFRTMLEATIDMILYGTAVIEVGWKYQEREMPVREVGIDMGGEYSSESRWNIPYYDDVVLTNLDVTDFYPDPSRYRLHDMNGAAKKFKITAMEARRRAKQGLYDSAQIENAVDHMNNGSADDQVESFRAGYDQPTSRKTMDEFKDMIGYEYWGEVPWEDEGSSRRVITVINNICVRDEAFPLADPCLPFHEMIINPIQGRFYGISPAEVVRFDQSFADAIKILLAEAIIRQVHPPIAVDMDSGADIAALKAWKADAIVMAKGGPAGIGALRYDANVANGFAMLSGLKQSIQEASGAVGAIQGEPGPGRESATVGQQRMQFAMDRPELASMILEQECLPQIGRAILRRYQQFTEDTEDLKRRVGETPEPIWLGDIMGDFDVFFRGSRMAMNRQQKLQAWDRLVSMSSAIPPLQAQIPWQDIGRELIGDTLELPEVAAKMSDPQQMAMNALLMNMGNQRPKTPGAEPAGMLPAQAGGAPVDMGQ